jgi:hypothetical protein
VITDAIPGKASYREEFVRSDQLGALAVPTNDRLKALAERIESGNPRRRARTTCVIIFWGICFKERLSHGVNSVLPVHCLKRAKSATVSGSHPTAKAVGLKSPALRSNLKPIATAEESLTGGEA